MRVRPGPYDLIWCAGAVYFVGIGAALSGWRSDLAPGGRVAFSEPVLSQPASTEALAFWAHEYAPLDEAGMVAQVGDAGYEVVATRRIFGAAWAAYYDPLAAKIATLRASDPTLAVAQNCDENEREMQNWRVAQDEVASQLIVARPV